MVWCGVVSCRVIIHSEVGPMPRFVVKFIRISVDSENI